ncbi:MAG: HD domain-containing phosphohydrolase [Planctomycetota bacterium]
MSSQLTLGIVDFVDELVVAITNSRIYSPDHPRVIASVTALCEQLRDQLGTDGPSELVLGATGEFLFYDQRPLIGASLSGNRILEALARLDSGGLSFSNWANEDDMRIVVGMLGRQRVDAANYSEANDLLDQLGCSSIRFLPSYTETGLGPGGGAVVNGPPKLDTPEIPIGVYKRLVDHLQDTLVRVCHGTLLDTTETMSLVELILHQLATDTARMMSVSRYERYDAYTFGHSIRVAVLALNYASALTLDDEVLRKIGMAALLHDIGKARVPFEILHSTKRLDADERAEMNKHTLHGGEILLEQELPEPVAVATAFGHHRTTDQGGYPGLLHEHPLSVATRVVKICDVYEALTAVRPYKDRMSPMRAYRIMMSMGRHFDLNLLRRFIEINGIYPVGSSVQLLDGATARVTSQTDSLLFPIVQIEGEDFDPIDLRKSTGPKGRHIERLLIETQI